MTWEHSINDRIDRLERRSRLFLVATVSVAIALAIGGFGTWLLR